MIRRHALTPWPDLNQAILTAAIAFETPLLETIETKGQRLKIGFCRVNELGPIHPDTVDVVSRVADKLANVGHRVSESHPERLFDKDILDRWSFIFATVVGNIFEAVRRGYGYELTEKDVERGTWVDYMRYKGLKPTGISGHRGAFQLVYP